MQQNSVDQRRSPRIGHANQQRLACAASPGRSGRPSRYGPSADATPRFGGLLVRIAGTYTLASVSPAKSRVIKMVARLFSFCNVSLERSRATWRVFGRQSKKWQFRNDSQSVNEETHENVEKCVTVGSGDSRRARPGGFEPPTYGLEVSRVFYTARHSTTKTPRFKVFPENQRRWSSLNLATVWRFFGGLAGRLVSDQGSSRPLGCPTWNPSASHINPRSSAA